MIRRIRSWLTYRSMLHSLRADLDLHSRSGFRMAFSITHTKDFYCSNVNCMVKHKVH